MTTYRFVGNAVAIGRLGDLAVSAGMRLVSVQDQPFMFTGQPFCGGLCALLTDHQDWSPAPLRSTVGNGVKSLFTDFPAGRRDPACLAAVIHDRGIGKWLITIYCNRFPIGLFPLPLFGLLCVYSGFSDLAESAHDEGFAGVLIGGFAIVITMLYTTRWYYRRWRSVRRCIRLLKSVGVLPT